MDARLTRLLRADAIGEAGAGLLLLAGSWDGLYDLLDLPQAKPALFVQLGGAVVLALAYLLWAAAANPALARPVALATAAANAMGALIIATWLLFGDLGSFMETQGRVELWVVAGLLVLIAAAEARGASRLPSEGPRGGAAGQS